MKILRTGLLIAGLFVLAEAAFAGRIGDPFPPNPYSYVEANPLSFIDPNGLDRWGVGSGLGIVYTQMSLGRSVYYDAASGESLVFETRNAVTSDSLPGAADSYSGLVTLCQSGQLGDAYGTAKMRTTDPRSRWIHGGGTGTADPYAPRQGWVPTHGCTRGQNVDVESLCSRIQLFRTRYPEGTILYRRD
jgi:hypothetical protein